MKRLSKRVSELGAVRRAKEITPGSQHGEGTVKGVGPETVTPGGSYGTLVLVLRLIPIRGKLVDLPEKIYSKTDIENARTKGQVVGWLQGGGVVVGGFLLLNVLGWLPGLLLVGGVGYVGYRVFFKSSSKKAAQDADVSNL